MPPLPITAIFVTLYAFAILLMVARVGFQRKAVMALHGDKKDKELHKRIRIHGNLTETAPAFGLALLLAELLGLASLWLGLALGIFLIGRFWHYRHFNSPKRGVGMLLTLLPGVLLGVWSLYASLTL